MTTLLVAGLLFKTVYAFTPDTKLTYDVSVNFNGFLPLFGGNEGTVDVKMGVDVAGQAPDNGNLKATSEIKEFEVAFNGAKLPLAVENVNEFFPKTTITLEPTGKILTNDAPDKKLPVRLPGLDVKRFPDITYVPIELPADGLAEGTAWTFTRDFGGTPINYSCKAASRADAVWKIDVKLEQKYTVLESPSLEVVTKTEDAVNEVTTTMTGEGVVEFDAGLGRVAAATMTNTAVSEAKSLKSGDVKKRSLVTKYTIKLRGTGDRARTQTNRAVRAENRAWWDVAVDWGRQAVANGRTALVWVQTAAMFGLRVLPRELEALVQPVRPYLKRWLP